MRLKSLILAGAALLATSISAQATNLQQFGVNELTERSDAVFRGTVIDVEQVSLTVGGGELPAVRYRLKVDEMLKGIPDVTKENESYMEIQMVGSLKSSETRGDMVRFSVFEDVPKLTMGSDYVLFMTPESSVGLSVTVGLGQGAFDVTTINKTDMVVNQFGNNGLGMGDDGAITYNDLKSAVAASGN